MADLGDNLAQNQLRFARTPVERPSLTVARLMNIAGHFQAKADDVLCGHVIAVLGQRREDAHHVFQRGGADIDVEAVVAQNIHGVRNLRCQAKSVGVADTDHPGLPRHACGAGVFRLADRIAERKVVGLFGHRHDLLDGEATEQENYPRIADIRAVGVIDRFVEEVQLGAEIDELLGFDDVLQRLAAFHPGEIVPKEGIVGDQIVGYGLKADELAFGVLEVGLEVAVRNVLADRFAEFLGCQRELEVVDLIHEQRFLGIVHDRGVVPVKNSVGTLFRIVIRRVGAQFVDHCL